MMKRISIAFLAAMTAIAVLADGQAATPKDDKKESPAERLERCKRLVDRYQQSTVRVLYTLKLDDEGEPPEMEIRYMCPNCNRMHSRDVDYYFERNIPFDALGYVIAPNKVLMQDLRVLPKWTKSIEVEFNGVKYKAKETLRYPQEGGILLETEKPIEGARPLEFSGSGIPEKPSYFYVVRENGLTVSGIKGSEAASFKHFAETGKNFYKGMPNTIVVNEKDEAVTVALQMEVELGKEQFAPPSEWKSVPASSFVDEMASMESKIAKFTVPLYIRLEAQSKDSGRYRSGSDEMYAPGLALGNGEVLVPLNLTAEDTARLNSIEYVAKDGKKTKLEFVGSLDEWGAFVARFQDGKLPDGFSPAGISTARPVELLFSPVFATLVKNNAGKLKIKAVRGELDEFKLTWGGAVVPDVGLSTEEKCLSAALDADGSVIAISLSRRQPSSRWSSSSRSFTMLATDVSELVAGRAFNPEFVPRSETDRNRVAWIGVEVVNLTSEVAREKKITEFLKDDSSGALVTKVYQNTPAGKAGIKEGDVLLTVRAEKSQKAIPLSVERDYGSMLSMNIDSEMESMILSMGGSLPVPWPNAEGGVNGVLSRLGIGSKVVVAWVSDRTRREATMTLEQIPVHYTNARRSRNRDIGMTVCDMTYEVRSYFRFDDDAPGVVISKLKPGDPAAVAGLKRYEIITDVNGKPVKSAKEFGAAIKGQKELTFSVRQLTSTRVVRISLSDVKEDDKK